MLLVKGQSDLSQDVKHIINLYMWFDSWFESWKQVIWIKRDSEKPYKWCIVWFESGVSCDLNQNMLRFESSTSCDLNYDNSSISSSICFIWYETWDVWFESHT